LHQLLIRLFISFHFTINPGHLQVPGFFVSGMVKASMQA
jgi:hypothetical protein